MKKKLSKLIDQAIKFCFHAIFFLTPLIMYPTTSELFEFNKMWFVFGTTLVIFFLWMTKAIISEKIEIKKTPLDIPILLFLLSQIISTIFSIDPHVSIWGYYSRFNGGLLSIFSYIFLYYAFASNCIPKENATGSHANQNVSIGFLKTSLASALVVSLWGIPSHFGYDPSCFVFRGSFDVSCWTDAFQPRVRIFSTLGQPNWLASYLAILLPVILVFSIKSLNRARFVFYFLSSIIFFLALVYSGSQSGFLAALIALVIFTTAYTIKKLGKKTSFKLLFKEKGVKTLLFAFLAMFVVAFFAGQPIQFLNKFAFGEIVKKITTQNPKGNESSKETAAVPSRAFPGELGGTDSGEIRKIVWSGALKIFVRYPLFGSGVETFAYAYYQDRPAKHNLTSEWDYLYNKAHNEYLNYLATTGIFGLLTYLLLIGSFLFWATKYLCSKNFSNNKKLARGKSLSFENPNSQGIILQLAILAGFVSILVANFFGFSVVVTNLYLFLLPLFFFETTGLLQKTKSITFEPGFFKQERLPLKNRKIKADQASPGQIILVVITGLIVIFFEIMLFRFWQADKMYNLGNNLDKTGDFLDATGYLEKALNLRPGEDLYRNELASNLSVLSLVYAQQQAQQASEAAQLAQEAKKLSDEVIANHPKNVTYFKTRTKILFNLSQLDENLLPETLLAIEKANALAPTDPKVAYNLGLLYARTEQIEKGLEALQKAITLKPDYADPRQAIALFYMQMAKDIETENPEQANDYKEKAKYELSYILENLAKDDKITKSILESIK